MATVGVSHEKFQIMAEIQVEIRSLDQLASFEVNQIVSKKIDLQSLQTNGSHFNLQKNSLRQYNNGVFPQILENFWVLAVRG